MASTYLNFGTSVFVVYLECAVVSLQLPAQALQLAASQDGLAVFAPQVVFLLDELILLLLQHPHLLLGVPMLFQLSHTRARTHTHQMLFCWGFFSTTVFYLLLIASLQTNLHTLLTKS